MLFRSTFAEPVKNFCLLAEEREVRKGIAGPIKLIRFVECRNTLTRTEFQARWFEEYAQHVLAMPSVRHPSVRYVQNQTLPPEQSDGWGLGADCVDEFWFESEAAAIAAFRSLATLDAGMSSLTARITCVMTNEVVLHDLPEPD